jgi:hypothetical protein
MNLEDEKTDVSVSVSAKEIEAMVLAQKGQIVKNIVAGLVTATQDRLNYTISDEISKVVKDEIVKIVSEEMEAVLVKYREQIQQAIITSFSQIGAVLTGKLVELATKNLTGYQMSDIIKKLFSVY